MLHSLIIQSDVVGDTCDVLAVRRSCPSGGYRIAKNLFECLHISSGPGHFNGVPDRAFHFLICGLEMFRDGGYNSFVTLLTTSMSFPDKMIASRK